jgi:flagellin-specific chaperone FliS
MTRDEEYLQKAKAYADGVKVLFAPSGVERGERGGRGPASPSDLSAQAEKLAATSADLNQVAAAKLSDADPGVRSEAAEQLLAKALTDLQVSAYLLESAQDEEEGIAWNPQQGPERSSRMGGFDTYLEILTAEAKPATTGAERGGPALLDLTQARKRLKDTVDDVLATISERAGDTGKTALTGLMGLGAADVAKAAGLVGLDIANVLGQGERVTLLYKVARDFIARVYEALLALLGPAVQAAVDQVQEWLKELNSGLDFNKLMEKLYGTQLTSQDLHQEIDKSEKPPDQFVATSQAVELLEEGYRKQTKLAGKLLTGVKWVGSLSTAILPQAKLFLWLAYLLLGGYVVLTGADYVDAEKFRLLDRVPGVRRTVEENLKSS